jgi:hypothetical protein
LRSVVVRAFDLVGEPVEGRRDDVPDGVVGQKGDREARVELELRWRDVDARGIVETLS